ncbi:hypothetical protein RF11_07376 [Thelohanellus kitauei]|uniref:Uncharacterized protein n=1 Tax=Thelohanellus kitauei TaxID=669202 RepID=A0A0C2I624_THEKT|nr:hypothetical protein RF11_07376 [Thelohanellus kitauei]
MNLAIYLKIGDNEALTGNLCTTRVSNHLEFMNLREDIMKFVFRKRHCEMTEKFSIKLFRFGSAFIVIKIFLFESTSSELSRFHKQFFTSILSEFGGCFCEYH